MNLYDQYLSLLHVFLHRTNRQALHEIQPDHHCIPEEDALQDAA